MPRYREYCPGRVVEQLTPTLRIEARCMLHEGHDGDCAADPTRWRLRWARLEGVGVSEEAVGVSEAHTGTRSGYDGGHNEQLG